MRIDTLPGFASGTPKRNALVFLRYVLLLFVTVASSDLLAVLVVG